MSTKNIQLSEDQAERLIAQIDRLGLSRSAAAADVGISAGYLSDILSLKKKPGIRTFSDICRSLSLSEGFVLTGDAPTGSHHVRENAAYFEVTNSMSPKKRDAIIKINQMLVEMDEDGCSSACLGIQEKKLLQDLLRQRESNEKAS